MSRTNAIPAALLALVPWFIAWCVLIALGTVLHWGSWIGPRNGHDTLLNDGVIKLAANVSAVLAAPGWIICTLLIGRLAAESIAVALIAHGIAWLLWLCCLALILRVRVRVLGPTTQPRGTGFPACVLPGLPTISAPGSEPSPGFNSSRRRLLVDGSLTLAGLSAAGTLAQGTLITPWNCQLVRYSVPIRDLPPALRGLRLVYISDTHLGPRVSAPYIRSVLARAIALKPDLFLLGGDYVHNGPRQIAPAAALFAPMVATGKPVLGVLGNHDWYADGLASSRALREVGIRMIDNDRAFLDASTRQLVPADARNAPPVDSALCIAGIGDLWQDRIDPAAALGGVPDGMPRLLLSHNPDAAEDPRLLGTAPGSTTAAHRVDLMLSGHTHGGQVRFPFLPPLIVPSRFRSKYARGLIQGPAFPVLVSAGVGVSLIPVRIGVPPELLEITLT
ncbi:MAG: metallophosphoesterase [Phycisphaerales bacterium]